MEAVQTPEPEDLSSRTVLMLVALTLVVSFISAWVSISTADSIGVLAPAETGVAQAPSQARVSLEVTEPHRALATGKVTLEIVPNG